ncbi:hypothetical protein CAC42_3661 [Sphaceloma murrayae]|uniref:Ubiquitin-like protease family profile domain-containing protein n=1 Tax=Sphaceloma murrayae TaxID=2082308 RepID=A0A2K1QPY9_9PEZI|nr:hypothetical protein CAC42_3661 [Sphaceloma murrayae]
MSYSSDLSALARLPAALRERIAALEAGASTLTAHIVPEYQSIRSEIISNHPGFEVDSVFSTNVRTILHGQVKLYEQARPAQRHLRDGSWALDESRFATAFGADLYFNYRFIRSLRDLSKLESSFDTAYALLKAKRKERAGRSKPMKGVKKTLDWLPWDPDQVLKDLRSTQILSPASITAAVAPSEQSRQRSASQISPQPERPIDDLAGRRSKRRRRQSSLFNVATNASRPPLHAKQAMIRSVTPGSDARRRSSSIDGQSSHSVEIGRGIADNDQQPLSDSGYAETADFVLGSTHDSASIDLSDAPSEADLTDALPQSPQGAVLISDHLESPSSNLPSRAPPELSFLPQERLNDEAIYEVLTCLRPASHEFRVVHPAAVYTFARCSAETRSLRRVLSGPMPKTLIVPLFWQDVRHWTLGQVQIDCTLITHFDSLAESNRSNSAHEVLESFVLSLPGLMESKWRHANAVCQQQMNAFDCGVHVILNALSVMHDMVLPVDVDTALVRSTLHTLCNGNVHNASSTGTISASRESENHAQHHEVSPMTRRYQAFVNSHRGTKSTAGFLKGLIEPTYEACNHISDLNELNRAFEYFSRRYDNDDDLLTELLSKRNETMAVLGGDLRDLTSRWTFDVSSTQAVLQELSHLLESGDANTSRNDEMERQDLLRRTQEAKQEMLSKVTELDQRIALLQNCT